MNLLLARPESAHSYLNLRNTLLVSDYTFKVERWLKPTEGAAQIEIPVIGGRVRVAGRPLEVINLPLPEFDTTYLIFARYWKDLNGYGYARRSRPTTEAGASGNVELLTSLIRQADRECSK